MLMMADTDIGLNTSGDLQSKEVQLYRGNAQILGQNIHNNNSGMFYYSSHVVSDTAAAEKTV